MKNKLVDWFYPPRCPLCEGLVKRNGLACRKCSDTVAYVMQPVCMKCGRPVWSREVAYCKDCESYEHTFDQGTAVFVYDGVIRESLYRFKYTNQRCYKDYYAREIMRMCGAIIDFWNPEVILPVPIHKSRRRKRGYNQAELLAEELSGQMHIPWDCQLLERSKKTPALKNCTADERRQMLYGVFRCTRKPMYQSVLLVDDIYTTGSTVEAIARVLKKQGVQKVYVLCVAVGVPL